MLQRTGATWLTAIVAVYADEILAKPRIQGLREDVQEWAAEVDARVSYTDVTIAKDFVTFSLNLMYESCGHDGNISEGNYLSTIIEAMNKRVKDMLPSKYKGSVAVYIKCGNHLAAKLS